MSQPKNYTYWIWCDDLGLPMFVGWGRYVRKKKYGLFDPSTILFQKRFDHDSELNDWLRQYTEEPIHCGPFSFQRTYYHKVDARTWAVNTRKKLIQEGVRLLNPKPYDKLVGGGRRRPVNGPYGYFESVRQAAQNLNVDPGSITLWCQTKRHGWHYVTPLEIESNEGKN